MKFRVGDRVVLRPSPLVGYYCIEDKWFGKEHVIFKAGIMERGQQAYVLNEPGWYHALEDMLELARPPTPLGGSSPCLH